MNVTTAAERLGISARRIHYWADAGYVEIPGSNSGRDREVDPDAFEHLRLMQLLNEAGFTVAAAARLARRLRAGEPTPTHPGGVTGTYLPLSEHITITLKERA